MGWKARWPAGVEAEGLNFRSTFAYPAPHRRKQLSRTLSRLFVPKANWEILHFLDPIPYESICRQYPDRAHHFRLMPDPVEGVSQVDPEVARATLGIPASGRYAGYLGVLFDQNRVARLLSAYQRAKFSSDDRLLLAGPMSETVRSCVAKDFGDLVRSGQVITIDRHLTVEELMLGVMASNVVCVPAKFRMGSSSFIIRAAAAGRPVLTDNFGWTGWAVREFDLGWQVDVDDERAFATSLRVAIENATEKTPTPAARRFVRFHSAENFKAHWTSRLRDRIGLQQDPNYYSWDAVFDESPAG